MKFLGDDGSTRATEWVIESNLLQHNSLKDYGDGSGRYWEDHVHQ